MRGEASIFFAALVCWGVVVLAVAENYYLDEGYCSRREGGHRQQCCPGRNDTCAVPYYGTLCYCDIFCNLTAADCCPDFWTYCMGMHGIPDFLKTHPPTTKTTTATTTTTRIRTTPTTPARGVCHHHGKTYYEGEILKKNCNQCLCKRNGHGILSWVCEMDTCAIDEGVLRGINGAETSWRAQNYTFLWGLKLRAAFKQRLGTFCPSDRIMQMRPMRQVVEQSLPKQFDAREKWESLITPILDQGDCAASWAFSTISVASDRLAIQSQGRHKVQLAPQMLISCNTKEQRACDGGYVTRAWQFMKRVGVVREECYPYESGTTGRKLTCYIKRQSVFSNQVNCAPMSFHDDRRIYRMTPPYRIAMDERTIMKEIMQSGPVQALMKVNADFFSYESGIYQRVSDTVRYAHNRDQMAETDYHSVKIVGWGEDSSYQPPMKYWIAANSWGPNWGEKGYFRIVKGRNENEIESFVIAAWPRVERPSAAEMKQKRMRPVMRV